jgi:hypothetical protein
MRPCHPLSAKFFIFFLVCLLAGCSAARLAYSNGELLSYWWLNGYVDFDANQQPWAKKRIAALFEWHRTTQLKGYMQVLTREQSELPKEKSQADILASYSEIKQHLAVLANKALPDLADLALSLQPHQIAHIEKKFTSNMETFRKDYLRGDTEQRQRFRFQKILEQAEYWFGSFNAEQKRTIRAASDARPLNNEMWMAERMLRQQDLIAMLNRIHADKPSREATMALIGQYLEAHYFGDSSNPEMKAFFDASRGSTLHLAALIINVATPAQKVRAQKKLQQWIDDFNLLSSRA